MFPRCVWHFSARFNHSFCSSKLSIRLTNQMQCKIKPNAEELSFGKQFTDHMLKIEWNKAWDGWQDPEIIPLENLRVHPGAKVFHYAVELFEGFKAFRGVDEKIRLFRPERHMERMNQAAVRSVLPTFDGDQLIECIKKLVEIDQEWVPNENDATLYVRPTLIGTDPTLGIATSNSALLYVVLCPVGNYFQAGSGAISLLADPQYTRSFPGGVGDRKMGCNYAPTILVQNAANSMGLEQVLWLFGEDHQITEVGTMNFFMVYVNDWGDKELRTPPLNGLILPGVTRDAILQLARNWGECTVAEESFTMPEVVKLLEDNRILEMFGAGTACVVSPIERIRYLGEDYLIPTIKQENPVFAKIKEELYDIQFGRKSHPWAVLI